MGTPKRDHTYFPNTVITSKTGDGRAAAGLSDPPMAGQEPGEGATRLKQQSDFLGVDAFSV